MNYVNGLHVGSRSRRQCCSLAVRSGKGYRPRMVCHFCTGFEPQLNILREDSPSLEVSFIGGVYIDGVAKVR